MKEEIIAGLDIGSTTIRLAIGQRTISTEGEELHIIGAVSAPTNGVSKGIVNSIEDVGAAIVSCLEKAERLVGLPISSVWVSVNDPHIRCERSRGVVAVGRSGGEITENDISRSIEAARALAMPANYEILHVIPIKFTVDSQDNIKDPVGMSGVRLEVETLIILGLNNQIKNLTKAIYRAGLDIEDLVLAPLAAAENILTPKQKELGAAIVSIGSSTTGLAVYEESNLLYTTVLPIGSEHITSDIAIGLRCPLNLAERIKIEYGTLHAPEGRDEIDISELLKAEGIEDEVTTISKKYVAEIIEARGEEIMERIDQELRKIDRSGMLPAGIFLMGGGSKLNGLVEFTKKKLRLPAALGLSKSMNVVLDKAQDPEYLTAIGLVSWANAFSGSSNKPGLKKNVGEFMDKAKNFFKKMIPQ
ncbi:MAG: cell division protein FtsA [Planctomycetes bacterium]|jgi:cell division protein FtsA|nr:cell division protein FtsA [Planctomycetota bacterium]